MQPHPSQGGAQIFPYTELDDEHHSPLYAESDFDDDQLPDDWDGQENPGDQTEADDKGEEKELATLMNMKGGDKGDITEK